MFWRNVFYISLVLTLFISFQNICSFFKSVFFLKNRRELIRTEVNSDNRLLILIPVLREQERIISTIEYFLGIIPADANVKIVICTTNKEEQEEGLSTQDLVNTFLAQNKNAEVSICNYPYKTGGMAHQLNYTLMKYRRSNLISDSDFVCIYNADSRPHEQTIKWVLEQIEENKSKLVFQQSAVFIKNYLNLDDYFSKAVSLYQSFWTLTHEIPRLRRQASNKSIFHSWSNVHCVGHGLFIRFDVLSSMGLFPVDTLTEDTYLGFKLRCADISVHPVPYIEIGDSPVNIRSALKQKYVWFWGPMLYPYYLYKYLNEANSVYSKFRSLILASQGILNAIRWLMVGPIVILLLVLPWLLNSGVFLCILSYFSIVLYSSLPILGMQFSIKTLEFASGQNLGEVREPFYKIPILLIFSLLHSVLHSVPAFFSLACMFRMLFTGRAPAKPKTDE